MTGTRETLKSKVGGFLSPLSRWACGERLKKKIAVAEPCLRRRLQCPILVARPPPDPPIVTELHGK